MMGLAEYYRVLGLRTGASFADVKASYRRLARRFHPDLNPSQRAKDRFIKVTQAYEALADVLQPEAVLAGCPPAMSEPPIAETAISPYPPPPSPLRANPSLSALEQRLKHESYQQLQVLLRSQKYPRAIALVEGLAQRLTQDREVRQWQAIAYQRWSRQLIAEGRLDKARIYLNKALKIDPLNRSLWIEVTRDFQQLESAQRPVDAR